MDQSPAACLASAHATDGVHGGATHVGGVGDLSFGFLLRTGAGRGGENLLPTCVLCHVNRSNGARGAHRLVHAPRRAVSPPRRGRGVVARRAAQAHPWTGLTRAYGQRTDGEESDATLHEVPHLDRD